MSGSSVMRLAVFTKGRRNCMTAAAFVNHLKLSTRMASRVNVGGRKLISSASTTSLLRNTTSLVTTPLATTIPSPVLEGNYFAETLHTSTTTNSSQPPSNDESTDDDDHNASTFCRLADQLSAESNRPRNSTTLERSVRQLTLIFQSLPFEHQKRVLLHLAKSLQVDRVEVRDKARALLDVSQNDDPAFCQGQ